MFQNTNYSTQTLHDHFPFRPKQIVHNRCRSRGFVVPLFSSKKRELLTRDNLGRSSDAFSPLSRQKSSSFECRTTVPPCTPTICQIRLHGRLISRGLCHSEVLFKVLLKYAMYNVYE